jgi:putative flippase GtrA
MGVQLATLVTLREAGGFDYLVATAFAVEVAILHNFIWHERWTWGDRGDRDGRWQRLAAFNAVSAALAIPGNLVFTALFAAQLNLHYVPANVLAVASCSLLTFLGHDRLVFVTGHPTQSTSIER